MATQEIKHMCEAGYTPEGTKTSAFRVGEAGGRHSSMHSRWESGRVESSACRVVLCGCNQLAHDSHRDSCRRGVGSTQAALDETEGQG